MTVVETCFVDNRWVAPEDAKISIFDSGLMYGEVLTETLRTFDGEPFEVERHLARFERSMQIARVEVPSGVDLGELVAECARRGREAFPDDGEVLVKLDVTRGHFGYYREPGRSYEDHNVFLHALPLPFWRFFRSYETGISVVYPTTRHMHSATLDTRVKHRSRLYQAIAEREAAEIEPGAVALLLDLDGRIAEGTGWNIFALVGGELLTPSLENCLDGVSRAVVIELCAELDIPVREARLRPYDLETSDEAFATATSYCLMPITSAGKRAIGSGVPGPLTEKLLQAWSERVGVDIPRQARELGTRQLERQGSRSAS